MTKKEREDLFEQLFSSELLLMGAARYCQHLHAITRESNYNDALIVILDSLSDVGAQRRKLRERRAA